MPDSSDNGNGNGGNGHPIFHFRGLRGRSLQDKEEAAEDEAPPEDIEEYHLDCRGKKRLFRLQQYGGGVACFLSAREIRRDDHPGIRVVMQFNPETEPPPYYQLRRKLAERLATRHVVRNPDTDQHEILNMVVRAHVSFADEDAAGPNLVIDDEVVSWEQLGRMLRPYEGWGLRLQLLDAVDE